MTEALAADMALNDHKSFTVIGFQKKKMMEKFSYACNN